ncbi:uncharacterized protein BT62DRAFT_938077 [Guyanagaster necrorhizus]|uniref:Uncharacterized protein n=1 Tax=Guyanagaster necrorhizus TaxID=856835 RepID=A0A9P7VI71_9AGAR|nr:uncharacterized protein BT62DRAFT_938077 [Guyanagaster necrorhizus MCA 3950]KAG7440399.1 hypothetical protein BT62DRAFT_938077 [Guyanagaster necrorhizus MCA 3950]
MPPTAALKLHHVALDSHWPVEVHQISTLFSNPVPHLKFSETYPGMTSLFTDLFKELRSATSTGLSTVEPESQPLLGFLDIILETVSSLRRMQQDPHPFTMPIWSTLVRALCYTCFNDVEIYNDTPFILPRNFVESVCDGHALMLVSFLYKNTLLSMSHSDAAPGESPCHQSNHSNEHPLESGVVLTDEEGSELVSDGNAPEVEPNTWTFSSESDRGFGGDIFDEPDSALFGDLSESEEWPCHNLSPSSSTRSLDMSFQAHVLLGKGRRMDAVLPVICIADRENIMALIASVAYQRRVWGIEEPIVGVILTKDGFSAQVILGWTNPPDTGSDSESPDDNMSDDLPMVHIAYSDAACAASGIFNLTDPISTLSFVQFIIQVRDHYNKIVLECCKPGMPANSPISWRSDLIDPSCLSDWGERGEEAVASWIQSLRTSSVDTNDDPPPYPVTPPPTQQFHHITMLDPNESRKKPVRGRQPHSIPTEAMIPTQSKNDKHSSRKGSTSTSTSSALKSKPSGLNAPSLNNSVQSASISIYSCSRFANKVGNGIGLTMPLSITTYTYDRYIFSVRAAILLNIDNFKNQQHVNEYTKLYETLTCFVDPGWQSMGQLPVVEGSYLKAINECFWEQLMTVRQRSPDSNLPKIKPSHQTAVSERLSLFFWATLGAFSRGQRKSVNEAESRLQWDTLLFHVLNSIDSDVIHVRPLFERTILLSRNRLVDELCSKSVKDVRASAIDRAKDYYDLCWASGSASAFPGNHTELDVIRSQEHAALNVARYLLQQTSHLFPETAPEPQAIVHRASGEPHTGKCDAVVVLTADDLLLPSTDCKIPEFITVPQDDSPGLFPKPQEEERDGQVLLVPSSQRAAATPPRSDKEQPVSSEGPTDEPVTLDIFKVDLKSSSNSFLTAFSETGCVVGSDGKRSTDIRQLHEKIEKIGKAVPAELLSKILFAILVVEHKRPHDDAAKPLNQARAYVDAAVRLLQAHGITGLPVFALATNGNDGVVLMAWHGKTTEKVYLVDRSVQRFDISSPVEVFHFATFLLRLRDYYVEHFKMHPGHIEAAKSAAQEMAMKAEKKLREAKAQAKEDGLDPDKVEVHIDWGWWKSAQTPRPPRSKESGKEGSKSKLEKVAEELGNLHLR